MIFSQSCAVREACGAADGVTAGALAEAFRCRQRCRVRAVSHVGTVEDHPHRDPRMAKEAEVAAFGRPSARVHPRRAWRGARTRSSGHQQLLDVLARAGVVDAGRGLVEIVRGATLAAKARVRPLRSLDQTRINAVHQELSRVPVLHRVRRRRATVSMLSRSRRTGSSATRSSSSVTVGAQGARAHRRPERLLRGTSIGSSTRSRSRTCMRRQQPRAPHVGPRVAAAPTGRRARSGTATVRSSRPRRDVVEAGRRTTQRRRIADAIDATPPGVIVLPNSSMRCLAASEAAKPPRQERPHRPHARSRQALRRWSVRRHDCSTRTIADAAALADVATARSTWRLGTSSWTASTFRGAISAVDGQAVACEDAFDEVGALSSTTCSKARGHTERARRDGAPDVATLLDDVRRAHPASRGRGARRRRPDYPLLVVAE